MIDAAALEDAKRRYDFLAAVPGLALHARTNGGEYHGPCPRAGCGGADRFVVWPRHPGGVPLAWCRQCHEQPMNGLDFLMWRDGCDFLTACRRLGVTEAPAPVRPRAVAFYDYQAESGALLYQVVRREPKSFLCRRPRVPTPRNDVDTDWDYRMTDVPRVLYHLPALLAAAPDAVVWLVEGEKDADTLTAAGLLATTAPHGAKSWRPAYAEALRDRYVVAVPDADPDGAIWAAAVTASVAPVARRLKVVALPAGSKDVSDFLAGGGTLDDLQALARAADSAPLEPAAPAAPYRLLTAAELLALPPPSWLITDLFETGKLAGLYGFYGGGKTFLALDWALCIATGQPWQGRAVQAGPVVYICPEGSGGLGKRLRAWQQARGVDALPDTFRALPETVNLLDPDSPTKLLQTLTAYGLTPASLIVIDTLARSMPGGKEDNEFFSVVVEHAAQVQRATGAAVLVVHHAGKNELAGWRGGTAFPAGADTIIGFKNDDGIITLTCEKQKDHEYFPPSRWVLREVDLGQDDAQGRPLTSCVLDPAPQGVEADGVLLPRERQLLEALCEPVFEHGATLREMREATDLANQPIFRALNALKKREYVMDVGAAKTASHRYKATKAGYDALGIVPPWTRAATRLSESDTDAGPTQAGSDTDALAVSAGGVSASDTPPTPNYVWTFTESHGLSGSDTDQHGVTAGSDSHYHTPIGGNESHSVAVPDTDGATDSPPDAPDWQPPPDTAPPRPAHLGYCGHGTLAVAWDAGPPARWRCRSCWELHKE